MCPVCLTSAALIAGSVTSTGGIAAVVIKKLGSKKLGIKKFGAVSATNKNATENPAPTPSQEDNHA